jgi:hypothetical protein
VQAETNGFTLPTGCTRTELTEWLRLLREISHLSLSKEPDLDAAVWIQVRADLQRVEELAGKFQLAAAFKHGTIRPVRTLFRNLARWLELNEGGWRINCQGRERAHVHFNLIWEGSVGLLPWTAVKDCWVNWGLADMLAVPKVHFDLLFSKANGAMLRKWPAIGRFLTGMVRLRA